MKKTFWAALLVFFAFAGMSAASEVTFVDSYDTALKTATEQGKKVLISFWRID
ncbi:MAG: hypothetical protein V3V99_02725 [candidate division Zixibacteria bacterium]